MAVVDYTYTLYVNYNANGGDGAPATQTFSTTSPAPSVTVSGTISYTVPTRSGYTFNGWWQNGYKFVGGSAITATFSRNGANQVKRADLVAAWVQTNSQWGTVPSSVSLDGTTAYTFNVSKAASVDHHTMTLTLGTETLTYTNVNTSQSVTFPTSWQQQIPNSTSGSIACSLTSYDASNNVIGSAVTVTVTGTVPVGVVPTISVVASRVNTNATVATWDILLQGFSQIQFTATASGTNGSTIASITYSGAGIQTTTASATATSSVLSVTGSQTWTITARDSRGRTASTTYTETVYEYTTPSISNITARRCNSLGTIDEASGTYVLFNGVYAYSSANNNNTLTEVIDYKIHTGVTWTTIANSYTSGIDAVIGGGAFDADKTYDLRLTITDALGNSATYSVFVASVQGFALGLKNDRARFGGVPTHSGLQIDWDIYLGNRKLMSSLWTGTWSSGDITVDGISDYTLFLVRMSGQGTMMFVSRYDDGVDVHFRGMNGFALTASSEQTFYIWATMSGDTLTMQYCHSLSGSTRTAQTVSEIIGVI